MFAGTIFVGGKDYSKTHLTANDYYEKGHSVTGEWYGQSCQNLGLSVGGSVEDTQFESLRQNEHPVTGEQLTKRHNVNSRVALFKDSKGNILEKETASRRAFADITVSMPKTFSVVGVTGGDKRVYEWHERALKKAVAELEKSISRRESEKGIKTTKETGKMVAALYTHDSNRALEPQIHTHCIIFNVTDDSLAQERYAVDYIETFKRLPYFTSVYRDELAHHATKAGYELSVDKYGAPQIKGLEEIAEKYNERTKIITQLIELCEDKAGITLSKAEKKLISFASRGFDKKAFDKYWEKQNYGKGLDFREYKRKFVDAVSLCSNGGLSETTTAEVIKQQIEKLSQEEKKELQRTIDTARAQYLAPAKPVNDISLKEAIALAIEKNFERNSVVKDYELKKDIYKLIMGSGEKIEKINFLVNDMLQHKDLVSVGHEITTIDYIKKELYVLDCLKRGKGTFEDKPTLVLNDRLSSEQQRAVKEIIDSKSRYITLSGYAGTGKSFVTSEIIRNYISNGNDVICLAPTSTAKENLRGAHTDNNDVKRHLQETETLQRFIADKRMQEKVTSKTVIILDESGMISINQANELFKIVEEKGARLLQIGDDMQHVSVEAGDAYRIQLQYGNDNVTATRLEKIKRQDEKALGGDFRKAAQLFAKGNVSEALDILDKNEVLKEAIGTERYNRIAESYVKAVEGKKKVIVVNPTNRENDVTSEKIREKLRERGLITSDERKMIVYRSKNWEKAQKKVMSNYDETTYLIGKSKEAYRFCKYDRETKEIVAVTDKNKPVYISKSAVKDFDICEKRELEVARGDKIMLKDTQKHKDGNFSNGEIVEVKGFDKDRIVTTDDRVINIQQYDYAYSSTSHKAQGTTVDKVIIGFDRESVQVADQKLAYVASTRGVHDIEVYCENKAALYNIESRTGNRKSAVEIDGNPYSELYQKREFSEAQKVSERIEKINRALDEKTEKGQAKTFVASVEKSPNKTEEKENVSIKQKMR